MRKLMREVSIGLLFLFVLATAVFADGSIYSTRAFGVSWYFPSGQAVGMGGVAMSSVDSQHLNWANPAALPASQTVQVSCVFLYQHLKINSKTQVFKTGYANFNGVMFSVPVHKRMGVAFGIQPLTNINLKIKRRDAIKNNIYTKSVKSSGGLNSFFLMIGYRPLKSLLVGIGTNFIMGKMEENWRVDFIDSHFRDNFDQFRTKAWGMNYTVGVIAEPLPGWHLGGIYGLSSNLHLKFETSYYSADIKTSKNATTTYPKKIGIGTSYHWKGRWQVGFDFVTQDWQNFQLGEEKPNETIREYRYAGGIEFTPSRQTHAFYLKQISYRAGFTYSQPYFLGYNGEKLHSYLFTFGFGLPFAHQTGVLDLSFEIGKMGDLEKNMFAENIFRMVVFITSNERWFVR